MNIGTLESVNISTHSISTATETFKDSLKNVKSKLYFSELYLNNDPSAFDPQTNYTSKLFDYHVSKESINTLPNNLVSFHPLKELPDLKGEQDKHRGGIDLNKLKRKMEEV